MKLLSTVCPTPYKDNFQRIYKRIYTKSTTTSNTAHSIIFVECVTYAAATQNGELNTKKKTHY